MGTGREERLRPALAQTQRQRADRLDRTDPPFALGRLQHPRQRFARQHRLFARLQRTEAGGEPRLDRKGREQPLAEAMNGLNAKPAARRVEHSCEQRPGAFAQFGAGGLA